MHRYLIIHLIFVIYVILLLNEHYNEIYNEELQNKITDERSHTENINKEILMIIMLMYQLIWNEDVHFDY